MARKLRLELAGGLYHIITRGNERRDIFHCVEDHQRFLRQLAALKEKLPFYLYAYCLMTNHIHLLIERRDHDIGRIMHRLLTGYSQYYNRRYHRVGHLLQGRHKAILCQSDPYLAELVRYIHLNPVRANMVRDPADHPFSSHRAYTGAEPSGIVDVDPVLRHFGPKRAIARRRYERHIVAGMGLGHRAEFYLCEGGVLGSEEFVDATIHRIGEVDRLKAAAERRNKTERPEFVLEELIAAVSNVCQVAFEDLCGTRREAQVVIAKEVFITTGRQLGASVTKLAEITGLNPSTISRRHDAAIRKMQHDRALKDILSKVIEEYESNTKRIAISQA